MEGEQAVVFDRNVIDQLNYTGEEKDFFGWLVANNYDGRFNWRKVALMYRPWKGRAGAGGLSDGFADTHTIVPDTKYTKYEKRLVKCLQGISDEYANGRHVLIGVSDTSAAWTDGATYICFERSYLKSHLATNLDGAAKLIHTLCHEASHDIDTRTSHTHDEEFYRRFHELTYGEGKYWSPLLFIGRLPSDMRKVKYEDAAEDAKRRDAKSAAAKAKKLGHG